MVEPILELILPMGRSQAFPQLSGLFFFSFRLIDGALDQMSDWQPILRERLKMVDY